MAVGIGVQDSERKKKKDKSIVGGIENCEHEASSNHKGYDDRNASIKRLVLILGEAVRLRCSQSARPRTAVESIARAQYKYRTRRVDPWRCVITSIVDSPACIIPRPSHVATCTRRPKRCIFSSAKKTPMSDKKTKRLELSRRALG